MFSTHQAFKSGGPFASYSPIPGAAAIYQQRMQFHHPAYLKMVDDGEKLLAGIAKREAFLLDTKKLVAGFGN